MIDRKSGRLAAAALAAGFVVAACTTTPTPSTPTEPTPGPTAAPTTPRSVAPTPTTGGTIYLLTLGDEFILVDPQRIYNPEDRAFLGATLFRSLESYTYSPDSIEGTTLTPDLATDLGRPANGGRIWSFTLRDGVTFQTGDPITCEDIKYGVSRTFAPEIFDQRSYAVAYLDIPKDADGSSSYKGPYANLGQDLYDRAVECDGKTITFHLNRPVADFNYATTLGFSPVPKAADIGQEYGTMPDSFPVSSGPYLVESYTPGNDGEMILVRNPNWNQASDPIRLAYPDRWQVEFATWRAGVGGDAAVVDQRLIASAGKDAFALQYGQLLPETVRTVFGAPSMPITEFGSRAVSGFDPFARFFWINVQRVPNIKIRQAIMVALDRDAIREIHGGEFHGSFADGILNPNIGRDYAPTGIWDGFFGQPIPINGDPELARRLIRESGETPSALTFTASDSPAGHREAQIVIDSMARAGISVTFEPWQRCPFGCEIENQSKADFGSGGWRADWPNASTVIPQLFTERGDWNLSHIDDVAFNAAVDEAVLTIDRAQQAEKWQALNRQAVENAWVIPTFFARTPRLAGTSVGPIYQWPTYSSWPYGVMYVTP